MQIRYVFLLLLSICVHGNAEESDATSCFESAMTQAAMNECAGWERKHAQAELDRVIAEIQSHYSTEPEFLQKLEESQLAWVALQDANLEMKYPLDNKQANYGSVYPMCAAGFSVQPILARIEYLKIWLVGHDEGEVCSGSVWHRYCLENNCGQIGN